MEKMFMLNKLMKISSGIFALCLMHLLSLTACTQSGEHRKNEQLIKEGRNVEQSTVLLNNKSQLIPLKKIEDLKIASVNIGSFHSSVFDSILNKYALVKSFSSSAYNSDVLSLDDLSDDLKFYNTVIIQVTDQSLNDPRTMPFILENQKNKQIILSLSGDVRSLKLLEVIGAPLIWSEKKSGESANFAAQLIFGGCFRCCKAKIGYFTKVYLRFRV